MREVNINIYNQLYLFINKKDLSDTFSSVCFVFPIVLCALHIEIKGELNKQKYYKN